MWKSETCTICNLFVMLAWVGLLVVAVGCAICKDCVCKLFGVSRKEEKESGKQV